MYLSYNTYYKCDLDASIRVKNVRNVAVLFDAMAQYHLINNNWQYVMGEGRFLTSIKKDGTPAGVPLLWPCRWRFRLPILAPRKGNQLERALCMALFVYAVWMPQTLADNSAIRCGWVKQFYQ